MSIYTTTYKMRYAIPSLQQQIEVAVMHSAEDIHNEDPATPDHENRMLWANWATKNSSMAWIPFSWPVSFNPTIIAAVEADPTGASILDADVQFAVNSVLPIVLADWLANPPSGAISSAMRK
jgi:hypothetical protein